jgi:lipoprotein-releasing system ATP-binding protein
VPVLEGINLELQAGESAAIIGPSGSGKSTLLNIIGTLDQPTSGSVHLDGQSVSELNEKELAAVRNQKIGFIFQSHHLLPQCSVLENVLVPTLAGPSGQRAEKKTRAESLLDRVGLRDRLHHLPGQLSGGERQRVAVVRALINQPRLLLADEPTGALDQIAAGQLAELLVQVNAEQNVTLIVVTHAAGLAKKMRRSLELAGGRLLES